MIRLTTTNDVGRIAIASNTDASIIWYCYERPFGTGISIFVQREVNGLLEPEVRLLAEGQRPKIFFDESLKQWIFMYTLNEKLYMITIDETTPPEPQASQSGTLIDHLRLAAMSAADDRTVDQIALVQDTGVAALDADNSPPSPSSVSVGVSLTPGSYVVRWRAQPNTIANQNLNVVGFNVYVRRGSDGALVRVNAQLIEFVDYDPYVYELSVPAVPGTYYVTQINTKGPQSNQLVEGRIRYPYDTILPSDRLGYSFLGTLFGAGQTTSDDLTFVVVNTSPVVILYDEVFQQNAFGDSVQGATTNVVSNYTPVTLVTITSSSRSPIEDTYQQNAFGLGLRLFISGSGLGSIIVG